MQIKDQQTLFSEFEDLNTHALSISPISLIDNAFNIFIFDLFIEESGDLANPEINFYCIVICS